MNVDDFASRIKSRIYSSPSRARAAVSRSHLTARQKVRLTELCDVWEGELTSGAVVGGPQGEPSHEAEIVAHSDVHQPPRLLPNTEPAGFELPVVLSLNASIRASLNAYGVSLLYAARDQVVVPATLMADKGVWTTELWSFMRVMGPVFTTGGEPVTTNNCIEVLDPRVLGNRVRRVETLAGRELRSVASQIEADLKV
jgi:hypothetical protein